MKLQYTHIIPPTSGITDEPTKKWAEKMVQFLDSTFRKVASIPFNRSENLSVTDTGAADTTFTFSHHLGRVPSGFLISRIDKAGIVYADAEDYAKWSTRELKLKCSAANAAITVSLF